MNDDLKNFGRICISQQISQKTTAILIVISLISCIHLAVMAETFRIPPTEINDDGTDNTWEQNCDIAWNSTSGEIYVVWQDGRNGDADIFFAKSENGGKTFIGQKKIHIDAPFEWQINPSIAWNPSNGFIYVVWALDGEIYFARSEDGGDTWLESLANPINDDITTWWMARPDVATDGNNIYIAWLDNRRSPKMDVCFSKSGDEGDSWSANVLITGVDFLDEGNMSGPSVTASMGYVYVAWADNRFEGGSVYDVILNRSQDGGNTWPFASQRINSDALWNVNSEPSIVTNSTGQGVYTVWQDDRWSGMSWDFDIYFDRSSDYGATWLGLAEERQIDDSPDGGHAYSPYIAIQNGPLEDSLYVVWHNRSSGLDDDIYYSTSTDSGYTWSTPNERVDDTDINFNLDDDDSDQFNPAITINVTSNIAYVAWHDYRDSNNDIWFSKSNIGSGVWYTPNVNVDRVGYDDNRQQKPSIDVDNTGRIHAVWADDREGDYDIFYSNSSDKGITWNANLRVNKGNTEAYRGKPAIAIDKSNNYIYIVWESDVSGDYDIYLATSTDGGITFSDAVRVNDETSASQFRPDVAVDLSNHNVYVVWCCEEVFDVSIRLSKSTDYGQSFDASVFVNDTVGLQIFRLTPVIAVDSDNGNIYVAWSGETVLDRKIYAANSTDLGKSFGSDKTVSDDTTNAIELNPNIAVNGSGHIAIVWEGEDANAKGIRSTYSSDFGDTFGDGIPNNDVLVNDDTLGDQETPALTADGTYFYAVWRDERNSPSWVDIFFSKSGDGGLNWGTNYDIGGVSFNKDRQYPCISTYADQIFVAWRDNIYDSKYDVLFSNATILNAAPWVLDLNEEPKTIEPGAGSVYISANGSDDEDWESEFVVVEFEYRDPNWPDWNTTYLPLPASYDDTDFDPNNDVGHWYVDFVPPANAPEGYYSFRVRFQDQTGMWSNWFYDIDAVNVTFQDITPPIIFNLNVISTDTTATITWETNEPANSTVEYGLTKTLSLTEFDPSYITSHLILLSNLEPGRLYHFRVRSADPLGNWDTLSGLTFTTKFPINLEPGWNMISVPLNQTDTDFKKVLESISGDYDAVRIYDANDPSDPWKQNHTAKPSFLNDLKDVNRFVGIWVHITNPLGTTLLVNGAAPEIGYINQITLYEGWNFVGYPSLIERAPASAGLPVGVNGVFWYNATSAQWEIWDPGTYHDPDSLTKMKPGQGLWVHYTGTTPGIWDLTYV